MARSKGSANFAGSLEVLAGAPVDARLVVDSLLDLTAPGTFSYTYVGMPVAVKSEGSLYMLTGSDPTASSNWKKIGGDGGDVTKDIIAPEFSDTASYSRGDVVFYDGELYQFDKTHTGAWDVADVTKKAVDDIYQTKFLETPLIIGNVVTGDVEQALSRINNLKQDEDYMTDDDIKEIKDAFDATNVSKFATAYTKYSTEEQVVGEWIDGKPIYQKTYAATMPTVTTDGEIASNYISLDSNVIGRIVDIKAVMYSLVNYNTRVLPTSANNLSIIMNGFVYRNSTGNIQIESHYSRDNDKPLYITIRYTKTTD